jgi:hypothetical protein
VSKHHQTRYSKQRSRLKGNLWRIPVSKASPDTIVGSEIKADREQASPDTIFETEIKAERESVEDTREQASPDTTPESELLPIPPVSTRKPKKRKREN